MGAIRAAVGHEFRVHLEVPVACTLESEIDGLQIQPHTLAAGAVSVALRLEALPTGTRLRGLLLLRTSRLLRRLAVTGHAIDGGAVGNGQVVWQPEGGTAAPPPSPPSAPAAPASVPVPESARVTSTPVGPLVVSADGPFRTIGEAVRHAPPGGRILVKAGVYAECLTLTKKVEIVGDGAADVIVEGVDGNCIRLQADMARVRGLTLPGSGQAE